MKKRTVLFATGLLLIGYSAAVLAAAHHFNVVGESIGHTQDEAIDNAWREADETCYRSWGRSGQELTVLDQHVQPDTGYWYAKISVGCTVYD